MNSGEVQVYIATIVTWNNIYIDNGKLFCLKTHKTAEKPLIF